jgi:hypothetical protein
MGLMPLDDEFIAKNYQLFGGKFASHKKVLYPYCWVRLSATTL